MQTHCPHCDTRFRVTEAQINTADGFVRCGICKEVFNAFEVASQHNYQESLLDENRPEISLEKHSPTLDNSADIEAGAEETDTDDNLTTDIINEANQLHEIRSDDKPINIEITSATEESGKDVSDLFDETINKSLPHVVPDQFRDTYSYSSKSVISTLLWSIGILFLTTTLCIEYLWFNRDQFSHIAEFKSLISAACKQFECTDITLRDPAKLELITRNVYSHPNEKDALIVDVTMKNNAEFAQPYPVLQIDFSDIRGGTVAARRFLPNDYLPVKGTETSSEQPRLLQPDSSTSVTLEIQDPGKQAMTYEFNFL